MSLFKRIAAGAAAACLALSLTACQDTTWAYKIEGTEITAGMYLGYLMQAKTAAENQVSDATASLWDQSIENKKPEQWIKDTAKQYCLDHVAVEKEFERLKLKLSEENTKAVETQMDQYWPLYQQYYEDNGVGEKTFQVMLENRYKSDQLFDKYYAKGGLQEVPEDELKDYYKENYSVIRYIYMPMTDVLGNALNDEGKANLKKQAEGYVERLKKGEDFLKVQKEYEDSRDTSADENTSSNSSSNTSSTNTSSNTSSSGSSSNTSSTSSNTSSGATSSDNEEEIDNTPTLVPKTAVDSGSLKALAKAAFDAKFNEPTLVTGDSYYAVMVRYDPDKETAPYKDEDNHRSILIAYKQEDFEKLVSSWSKNYKAEANEAAISRYSPKKIKEPDTSQQMGY